MSENRQNIGDIVLLQYSNYKVVRAIQCTSNLMRPSTSSFVAKMMS